MVRRFYICGGNNEHDPAIDSDTITDPFFEGRTVTGFFKQGDRYLEPVGEFEMPTATSVRIKTGAKFSNGEVISLEVSPKKTGAVCPDPDSEGEVDEYYFPDIIKCVVARVNKFFEERDEDPFSVHYDRGLYNQVGSDKLKDKTGFLMIWLVMGSSLVEDEPKDSSYSSDVTCSVIIATTTKANYTMTERENLNFFPRLLPVYSRFIHELKNEPKLDNHNRVDHSKRLLPYWSGGAPAGPGQPNLWTHFADCIEIPNIKLKKEHVKYCTPFSNF